MDADSVWHDAVRPPALLWIPPLPKSIELNFEDLASARDPRFLERLRTLSALRKRMLDENSDTHIEDALSYGEEVWDFIQRTNKRQWVFKETGTGEEIDMCNRHWVFRWTSPLGGYGRVFKKVYSLYGELALALYQSAIKGWHQAYECFNRQEDLRDSTTEAIAHLRRAAGILDFLEKVIMDGGIEVKYNKVLPENKAETIRILSLLSLVEGQSLATYSADVSQKSPSLVTRLHSGVRSQFLQLKQRVENQPELSRLKDLVEYLDMRILYHASQCRYFHAKDLIAHDKSGEAICDIRKAIDEVRDLIGSASRSAKPRLNMILKHLYRKHEEFERENNLVHLQQIPVFPSALPDPLVIVKPIIYVPSKNGSDDGEKASLVSLEVTERQDEDSDDDDVL